MPVLVFFVIVMIAAAAGIGFLASMLIRDEPILGAIGLMITCAAAMAASAYGVLNSA